MSAASKSAIFGALRQRLAGEGPAEAARVEAVAARLARPRPNLIPARAQASGEARVAMFIDMAESVSATVDRVAGMAAVPGAVARYLAAHNLPAEVVVAPDAAVSTLPWETTTLALRAGVPAPTDGVSVTPCLAGVAETGTLVVTSDAERPYSLHMLPDTHIAVLPRRDILSSYEEAWTRLRGDYGAGNMPRTVLWVTGPSRTGDIEQTIQLGAHGPRRLHIVLVDDVKQNT